MAEKQSGIRNRIREYRRRRGWSQTELGQKLGLGRQAVCDMEAGRYLPNARVALEMAALFHCSVESLFFKESAAPGRARLLERAGAPLRPGARLALGYVRDELVGVALDPSSLSQADGYLDERGRPVLTVPPALARQTLLLFGCNPALEVLDAHIRLRLASSRTRCLFASSARALEALAGRAAHVASTHFHAPGDGDANIEAASGTLAGMAGRIMGFCLNEEGLMVAPGNPLGIRGAADLARPGLRFVNREPGAALRRLLDDELARAGLASEQIPGYTALVRSHEQGAMRVACGAADAALGLKVVARGLDLDFIPLAVTRCDLILPDDMLDTPAVDALLQALCSAPLRRELSGLPGFDPSVTGLEISRLG